MRWPPAILPVLALGTVLHAQCELQLQPGAPVSGPDGYGNAAVRLPGGDLVLGGSFVLADGSVANNIARYDGTSWSALGGGCNSIVYALAVAPNGDLIAGGAFTAAGGAPATRYVSTRMRHRHGQFRGPRPAPALSRDQRRH